MKLSKASIPKVMVSPETLGDRLRLYSVHPAYEYRDGQRTSNLIGYTYVVACSGLNGEQLGVRIPGKQLVDQSANDHLVKFDNLDLRVYPSYVKGQRGIDAIGLKATASGITVIDG
ncbi:hypothetical protein [Candidatus Allofournierella merdipullorum]|uniref:hypothetical protein n=1 Tax=Candidatus Allofournierella merdipullorum TaxID=2838595 RepID=UPI00374ED41D